MVKRPACGKCHSTNVFCDTDQISGHRTIRCMMCGNIYPGNGTGFYMTERKDEMAKEKAPCVNCGRTLTPVSKGLCWKCYDASRNFEQDSTEHITALELVKKKIDSGNVRPRGTPPAVVKAQQEKGCATSGVADATNRVASESNHKVIPITLQINVEVNVRAIRVG